VVDDPLEQTQNLIASLIRTLARSLDQDLVSGLLGTTRAGSAGIAVSIANRLVIGRGSGTRELNADRVTVLETVNLVAALADQLTVVLGRDLQDVSGLILQLLAQVDDAHASSIGLSLGALDLDLTVLDLDINVKLLAKLVDVLTTLANEEVGILLREVEGGGVSTLQVVLLLLFDKGTQLGDEFRDQSGGSTQRNLTLSALSVADESADRDAFLVLGFLLTEDKLSSLLLVLGRNRGSGGNDILLVSKCTQQVFLSLLQRLLKGRNLSRRGTLPGNLEVGRGGRGALIDKDNLGAVDVIGDQQVDTIVTLKLGGTAGTQVRVEVGVNGDVAKTRRGMSLDQVHDVGASTDSVLAITRVDLPCDRALDTRGESDVRIVSRFKLLDDLTTL
jgi:hypothetical protein